MYCRLIFSTSVKQLSCSEEWRKTNVVSPLTHVKDKEAEGAKHDGSDLLPVDRKTVPLRLVLREKDKTHLEMGCTDTNTFYRSHMVRIHLHQNASWSRSTARMRTFNVIFLFQCTRVHQDNPVVKHLRATDLIYNCIFEQLLFNIKILSRFMSTSRWDEIFWGQLRIWIVEYGMIGWGKQMGVCLYPLFKCTVPMKVSSLLDFLHVLMPLKLYIKADVQYTYST